MVLCDDWIRIFALECILIDIDDDCDELLVLCTIDANMWLLVTIAGHWYYWMIIDIIVGCGWLFVLREE